MVTCYFFSDIFDAICTNFYEPPKKLFPKYCMQTKNFSYNVKILVISLNLNDMINYELEK